MRRNRQQQADGNHASGGFIGVQLSGRWSRSHAPAGLPIPVVVRFDYRGSVPGARERAIANGERVMAAMQNRYSDLFDKGLLHLLLSVRDRNHFVPSETVRSTITIPTPGGH